jgi:Coenzyme PQQ synthesis protein D (PqqD)
MSEPFEAQGKLKLRPPKEQTSSEGTKNGMKEMVTFSNRVVVPGHVLIRHLDGESVLLNLETEKYFGLDATGTRMWELVTHSPDIETAYGALAREFEVEPETLRTHLTELLGQLVENGLLHVRPSDVESIPAV